MNYKNLFLLLMFVLLVNACSKNDHPVTSGESYQSGNTLYIDQLAIYTRDGINTDASLIQGYLDRNFTDAELKKWFYVNQTSVNDHNIGKVLDFLDNNRVKLNNRTMEIVKRTDTLMLIAELDSTNVPAPATETCARLLEKVPAITPTTYCNSGSCTRYRKTYPIIITDGKYYLPTLYFAVSNARKTVIGGFDATLFCRSISQDYPMLNFVNKALPSLLDANDTVLVQTGRLPMIKM